MRPILAGSASGGATALAGVMPGIGTVAAMVGGGLADACGWNPDDEDARRLSLLIAACGALERVGAAALNWFVLDHEEGNRPVMDKANSEEAAVQVRPEW